MCLHDSMMICKKCYEGLCRIRWNKTQSRRWMCLHVYAMLWGRVRKPRPIFFSQYAHYNDLLGWIRSDWWDRHWCWHLRIKISGVSMINRIHGFGGVGLINRIHGVSMINRIHGFGGVGRISEMTSMKRLLAFCTGHNAWCYGSVIPCTELW
jgi:hypothetical protein